MLKLADLLPNVEVHGVDYSPDSLGVAVRTLRRLNEQGRAFVREAGVTHLPYEDARFDLAMAIESHYFWPNLRENLGEICRVLRAGGTVALAGGVYFGGKFDSRNRKWAADGRMNCQTLPQLCNDVCGTGFVDVVVHEVCGHEQRDAREARHSQRAPRGAGHVDRTG